MGVLLVEKTALNQACFSPSLLSQIMFEPIKHWRFLVNFNVFLHQKFQGKVKKAPTKEFSKGFEF